MNFGLYLLAVFCSPLYFLIRKRIGMALVHAFLFFMSVMFFIMIVLAPLGFILWFFCALHAIWNVRKELTVEAAEVLATKMAEKMRTAPVPLAPEPPSIRR